MKEIKENIISINYREEQLIKKNYIDTIPFIKENNQKNDSNLKPHKKFKLKLFENDIDFKKIFRLLIVIDLLIKILSINECRVFISNLSKIKLKIKGIGRQTIYYMNKPDEIYINGNKQYVIQSQYNFDLLDNLIELVYNRDIISCNHMFYNCLGIYEIDLSNFNSSSVTNMAYMFRSCSNLVNINFSNFDTSKVTTMEGLFVYCSSLISLDLSSFDTLLVTNIENMFYDCWSLSALNISNWNTQKVEGMSSVFYNCSSLTSLNFSNWNTTLVKKMNCMFYNCSSLTSLDISHFSTSKVIDINGMFYNCSSLTSLNISNFDLSQTTKMQFMFYYCISLASLDLSNFNTSIIIDMGYVFYNCWSLTSVNLSGWNTKNVISVAFMFYNCSSLNYLDLSSFDGSKITHFENLFYNLTSLSYINLLNLKISKYKIRHKYELLFQGVPHNLVVCMNDESYNYTNNYIVTGLSYIKCLYRSCDNNWKLNQKKVIVVNNTISCIDNCNLSEKFKYEYDGQCLEVCPNGLDYNLGINKCKCELEKCRSCSKSSLIKKLCSECNNNYYQIENDLSNVGDYINCYKSPEGYYFDKNDSLYKKCYYTCKKCEMNGNNVMHNCLECNSNYSFELMVNNYSNCYKNCKYYYYFDDESNYHCTNNYTCPKEINKLILEKMKCIKNCQKDDIYKFAINNRCYKNYPEKKDIIINCEDINETQTQEEFKPIDINDNIQKLCLFKYKHNETQNTTEETYIQDQILKNLDILLTSNNYTTYNLDKGQNEIIKYKNLSITLTTLQNQKKDIYNISNNEIIIDFSQYEILLRNYYNISNNKTIYLKKVEFKEEGMKIQKIEFDFYIELKEGELIKLKKQIFENIRLDFYIPIEISEDIDTLNTSSGYFNDICYETTSDFGTDITLKDRQLDFIDKNKTVCQEDCLLIEYDKNLKLAKCSCKIKSESPLSIIDMKINKTKLNENFIHIKNIINVNIIKCYKKLFNKDSIIYNIGFYIFIPIIIVNIISIFIFYKKQLPKLNDIIKDIIFALNNNEIIENQKKKDTINDSHLQNNIPEKDHNKNNINNINDNKKDKNKNIKLTKNVNISLKNRKIKRKKNCRRKREINVTNIINEIFSKNIITNYTENHGTNRNFISQSNKTKITDKIKDILKYNDDEMNKLKYELALQYDNRTYFQYYISLLKTKHNLIFTLCNNNDYNSKIIKIDLFFISFAIFYTINTLFYNDNTIHNIYVAKGSFNIEYQFPHIIYSSVISISANMLLKLLALSSDDIISFKQNKSKDNIQEKENALKKKLEIKFILFFIISFIFLIFCWFYLSIFCAIYKNSQIHLIKDTSISFILSLIYPIIIYLLPGIFRIKAISNENNKRKCLYNFSKLLQMI